MSTKPNSWGTGDLDVVLSNWHTTLVTKIPLKNVSQEWAELYTITHNTPQDFFYTICPHDKFRVGETACEFTPENDRCPIRLGEKL
jgi:hypothetical protein